MSVSNEIGYVHRLTCPSARLWLTLGGWFSHRETGDSQILRMTANQSAVMWTHFSLVILSQSNLISFFFFLNQNPSLQPNKDIDIHFAVIAYFPWQ